MALYPISFLLAAAVAASPVAAQAQQQGQPRQMRQPVSASWALDVPGGAPIPCVKTGRWSDADPYSRAKEDNTATFRCGAVTVSRSFNPAKAHAGGTPVSWIVTDKLGKKWPVYVPSHAEQQLLDPIGSLLLRISTTLDVGGQSIRLIKTVSYRLVPAPQPVFR